MKNPTTAKVGATLYTIEFKEGLVEDVGHHADICYSRQHIRVDAEQGDDKQRRGLLHEMMHAICEAAGIGADDRLTTEQFIKRTSDHHLEAIRGNPDIIEWFWEE
jgi:hypothetical protein